MVCNIGQWVFNIFILAYGYKLNVPAMITVPMFVWIASLIMLPIIDVLMKEITTAKTAVGMIPILGIGIPGAFFQSNLYAVAGVTDERFVQAIIVGSGISGLIPQFVLIIIKIIFTVAITDQ